MSKLYCDECGSDEVQVRGWIDLLTGESEQDDDLDITNCWCKICQKNVYLTSFGEKKEEDDE